MECRKRFRDSNGLASTTPCSTKSRNAMDIDATSAAMTRYTTESVPRGMPYVINEVTLPAAVRDDRAVVAAVTDDDEGVVAMEGGTMWVTGVSNGSVASCGGMATRDDCVCG
jgi:hypothetical protein